jgi:hypothetical protein
MMTFVYRSPVMYFMGHTHQCTLYKSTYIRLYIWETRDREEWPGSHSYTYGNAQFISLY